MWITEFSDYKVFLKALIKTFPREGRGQSAKLAAHLRISPMALSHIMTRERHFTPAQALKTAIFFGLDERSLEYFLDMVSLAKADTPDLRAYYQERLNRIREDVQNIKNLVAGQTELSEADMGIYYSNWYYSGVWLLTAIRGFQDIDSISEHFKLSRARVGEIVAFLLRTGLCVQRDGLLTPGKTAIHVNRNSEFVNNHRRNWREKARERFTEPSPDDIFYSSPVSLSRKDAEKFRKDLLAMIKEFSKRVEASPEETLACLNIDWFIF